MPLRQAAIPQHIIPRCAELCFEIYHEHAEERQATRRIDVRVSPGQRGWVHLLAAGSFAFAARRVRPTEQTRHEDGNRSGDQQHAGTAENLRHTGLVA